MYIVAVGADMHTLKLAAGQLTGGGVAVFAGRASLRRRLQAGEPGDLGAS